MLYFIGVARGDPPQTPAKSIEAKLKSNEAKPSWTSTWPRWTWRKLHEVDQRWLHSRPPSPSSTRRSRVELGLGRGGFERGEAELNFYLHWLALQYFSSRILIVILCLVSCKPVTPPKKRNVWNILLYFKISQPTKYKKNKTKYIFEYSVVKWKHNGLVKVNIGYINWVKVKLQVGHSPNCLNFLLCHALLVFCGQFWGDATYFALSQNLS